VTRSRISANRPRHVELSRKLAQAIVSGNFSVGERFPTESDLQERFGVGRHTVREALKTLTDQGLLVRKPKVGTMVVGDKPQSQYTHLIRDIRGLLDFSGNTRLQIEYAGIMTPGDVLSDHLNIEPGAKWLRIAGIRYTREDNTPLCWSEIYVPQGFPLDRQKILAGVNPIYEYICAEHGMKLDQVEQEISAGLMGEQAALLLESTPGSATLTVVRRYLDQDGTLFEITINTYPAARYTVKSVIRQRA